MGGQIPARSAVDIALSRARGHATTAAVAAALVPLASLLTPAGATAIANITATAGTVNGTPDITYHVTSLIAPNSGVINLIVIPEIHLGDLIFTAAGTSGVNPLPSGWRATEISGSGFLGAGLYSGSAAGFIELENSNYGIGGGQSFDFTGEAKTSSTINAKIVAATGFGSGSVAVIDPIIPNSTVSSAPEPTSIALLGTALAGLIGAGRRRRKA